VFAVTSDDETDAMPPRALCFRRSPCDCQRQCGHDKAWPHRLPCNMRAPRAWYDVRHYWGLSHKNSTLPAMPCQRACWSVRPFWRLPPPGY